MGLPVADEGGDRGISVFTKCTTCPIDGVPNAGSEGAAVLSSTSAAALTSLVGADFTLKTFLKHCNDTNTTKRQIWL